MRSHSLVVFVAGLAGCNAMLGLEDVKLKRGGAASGGDSGIGGTSAAGGIGGQAGREAGAGAEAGTQGEGGAGSEAGGQGEGGEGNSGGCGNGTFDHDGDASTNCLPWSQCQAGQYVLEEGTGDSDRVCAACGSGTFSSGQNVTECSDWRDCTPGTQVSEEGSATADRQCEDCPDGTQSTRNNQAMCLPPGACEPGTVEITPATATRPAECAACEVGTFCAGGSAPVVNCGESWDHDADPATTCAAWTSCIAGSSVDDSGSATADRTCTSCASGTFSTSMNATSCATWRTCAAGTSVTSAGSATADRTCANCASGTFSTSMNATSCATWRTCAAGTSVTNAGSATADRTCANCASGTFSTSMNATSCATWRTCAAGTSVTSAGSATADRTCANCASGTFSTGTNSMSCAAWRVCTGGFDSLVQFGTSTSDAVCASRYRQFGTSSNDYAHGVAVDASADVYIAGETLGSLGGTNAGSSDGYVRKYNSVGSLQWTRQFGTSSFDYGSAIAVDTSANVYVAGDTAGSLGGTNVGAYDGYVRKYNSVGSLQWTQQFGTSDYENVYAVAAESSSNVYVAGTTFGALGGANAGFSDGYVRKYNSSGAHQWTRQFGTSSSDFGYAVAVDSSGNVYVAGYTDGSLAGTNVGSSDGYVRKYNSSGTHQWTQQFGTSSADYGYAVAVDSSGNVYVAGATSGSLGGTNAGASDGYVRKYNSSGAHQWTQQFGTSSADYGYAVAVDSSGGVYAAGDTSGSFGGTSAGSSDGYVRKYNSSGTHQWTQQIGTSSADNMRAVAVDAFATVVAAGHTQGSLVGTNAGARDAFVVQIPGA